MRRTKEKVNLQLPPKNNHIVLCRLTKLQQEVYARLLKLNNVEVMLTADDLCRGNCYEQGWAKLILKCIVLFQKVANHLGLVCPDREDLTHHPEKYNEDREWMCAAVPDDHQSRNSYATAVLDPELCGKWKILRKLLHFWHENGDKVLIFSMSLKILSFIEDLMSQTRYEYLVLAANAPQKRPSTTPKATGSASRLDEAGGVGLNLTAAKRVVIFDPKWNSAHDAERWIALTVSARCAKSTSIVSLERECSRNSSTTGSSTSAQSLRSDRTRVRLFTGVQDEGKHNADELFAVKYMFRTQDQLSLAEMSIY